MEETGAFPATMPKERPADVADAFFKTGDEVPLAVQRAHGLQIEEGFSGDVARLDQLDSPIMQLAEVVRSVALFTCPLKTEPLNIALDRIDVFLVFFRRFDTPAFISFQITDFRFQILYFVGLEIEGLALQVQLKNFA